MQGDEPYLLVRAYIAGQEQRLIGADSVVRQVIVVERE